MNNKPELEKFRTALKNGGFAILKEAVSYGYTRICINADDANIHKNHIKERFKNAQALLSVGLVDEIPKDQVEAHGCLSHIKFSFEEGKERFINEYLFIKPNSITFALVALNEIHEKKMEQAQETARKDKIELARQMVENILAGTGISLENFED